MRSATTWLGICGGAIMVILMGRDFRGAIITGILFVTFISWIPGNAVRAGRRRGRVFNCPQVHTRPAP